MGMCMSVIDTPAVPSGDAPTKRYAFNKTKSGKTAADMPEPIKKVNASTIFIGGADSDVGAGVVKHLLQAYPHLTVRCGVRAINAAVLRAPILLAANLVVTVNTRKLYTVVGELSGVDTLLIVPPRDEKVESSLSYILAAQEAGVKHVVMMSDEHAENRDLKYARQFAQLEKAVMHTGIAYTIIRTPQPLENQFQHVSQIRQDSLIMAPLQPEAPFAYISNADMSLATAIILASPSSHANQTYNLSAASTSYAELASLYSKNMKRMIRYEQAGDEDMASFMISAGISSSQQEAVLEACAYVNQSYQQQKAVATSLDFQSITKQLPATAQQFVESIAPSLLL